MAQTHQYCDGSVCIKGGSSLSRMPFFKTDFGTSGQLI